MDPLVTSSLISGGVSALGNLFGGSSAKKAAKAQMAFQERMRDTQYQAAVKDLRKAGLNPMLAYTQGGAGTPSGAKADVSFDVGKDAATAYSTYALAKEQRNLLKEQQIQSNSQATKLNAETVLTNNQNSLLYGTIEPLISKAKAEAATALSTARMQDVIAKAYDLMGPGGVMMRELSGPAGVLANTGMNIARQLFKR